MNSTSITEKSARPARRGIARRIGLTAAIIVLLLAAFVAYAAWRMNYVPEGLDYSTTLTGVNGLYQVSYEPELMPIPVNRLHSWVLTVNTAEGEPVDGASILVDGDMPQHGHGLPTRPQVTEYLGEGRYLVEGVKFQMGGWWVMDFEIVGASGNDSVRFNMILD